MDRTLKRYIRNSAVIHTMATLVANTDGNTERRKLKSFALKALSNYAKLRLKLLNNQRLMDVEQKAVIEAIKLGIKYSMKELGMQINTATIEEAVEKIMPDVLDDIHTLRVNLITKLLEISE